jgi:hypothetical protein
VQLGGPKSITKIKVWRSEDEDHEEPNIIFYIGDSPVLDQFGHVVSEMGEAGMNQGIESRVVKRSGDGKCLLRDYIIRARL